MDPINKCAIEHFKYLEGPRLAEVLDLVNVLVAAVIAVSWYTLRILVGEGAAECLDDGKRGEVLGGDEFDSPTLPPLLLLNEIVDLRIHRLKGGVTPYRNWIHWRP